MNVKMSQISKLCQFCVNMKTSQILPHFFAEKIENAAMLESATNFKLPWILKSHLFQNAVLFLLLFPTLFTQLCWIASMQPLLEVSPSSRVVVLPAAICSLICVPMAGSLVDTTLCLPMKPIVYTFDSPETGPRIINRCVVNNHASFLWLKVLSTRGNIRWEDAREIERQSLQNNHQTSNDIRFWMLGH